MGKKDFNLLGRFLLIIYLIEEIPFIIDGKTVKMGKLVCNAGEERWNIELLESETQIGVIDLDDDDGEEPIYLLEKDHILSIMHNEMEIWDKTNKKLMIKDHGIVFKK